MSYIQQPQEIEKNSFLIIDDIIRETRPEYRFASDDHAAIIKRAIHTTADFDWLDILHFSDGVIEILRDGIMRGCTIYTDTTMALSGINKTRLAKYGSECRCYVSDPRVVAAAKEQQMTRSMAAVDIAMQEPGEKILSSAMPRPPCSACWNTQKNRLPLSACRSVLSARQNPKMRWQKVHCRVSPRSAVKAAVTWPPRLSTPSFTGCRRRNHDAGKHHST